MAGMGQVNACQVRSGHSEIGSVLAHRAISTYLARLRALQREAEAGTADFNAGTTDFDDPDLGG